MKCPTFESISFQILVLDTHGAKKIEKIKENKSENNDC